MARPTKEQAVVIENRNNAIKDLLSKGFSQSEVARMFNIERGTVNLVAMDNIQTEAEITACINWLRLQTMQKKMNKRRNSYHLKHIIEKWYGDYISNDSLVEAVKKLDIEYELAGESGRFIFLPLSEKNFK